MDGEAESLTRKILKLARGGGLDALKFCLSRIILGPLNRFELPMIETATDIPKVFASSFERLKKES
jgi:hypothetical protein